MIRIIEGNNVDVMESLHASGERFALVYADPPFFSQRDYVTSGGEQAFSDKWPSLEAYLAELTHGVVLARDLLIAEGSLVLHLDPSAVHYAKVRCDEVFGRACFAGEIIWRYRRWPAQCRNFQGMHDVLLRYVRDPHVECRFNQLYEPLSASTIATFKGLRQSNKVVDGKRVLIRERVEFGEADGRDLSKGAALADVWEFPILAQGANERTGYPTQKPEALIARLVDALTNEGDAVLDPFCGSGVVPAVCHKRNRLCVSIDSSPVAIRMANERLAPILAQGSLFERAGS